MNENKHKT